MLYVIYIYIYIIYIYIYIYIHYVLNCISCHGVIGNNREGALYISYTTRLIKKDKKD